MRRVRVLLGLGLGVSLAASAQVPRADVEQLWLDPAARGSLFVGSGDTLPARGVRVGVGDRDTVVDTVRSLGAPALPARTASVLATACTWRLHAPTQSKYLTSSSSSRAVFSSRWEAAQAP